MHRLKESKAFKEIILIIHSPFILSLVLNYRQMNAFLIQHNSDFIGSLSEVEVPEFY